MHPPPLPPLSSTLLSTLLPPIGLAFTLQSLVAVPSIIAQTEKYYDLSGSLTYLSCLGVSLGLPLWRARNAGAGAGAGGGAGIGRGVMVEWGKLIKADGGGVWNWRQVVLSAAVGVWAGRLGTYLFTRISADNGQDSRFSSIRSSPPKFLSAFLIQAAWVSTCLMPVLALNAIPASYFALLPASVAATDILGLALFAGGFGLEVIADRQKSAWLQEKREKKHDEAFLTRGLWGRSRHPNYFGEMMLWTGIAVVAGGVLVRNVGQVGMGFAPLSLLLGGGQAKTSTVGSNANAAAAATKSLFRGRALGLLMAGISPAFVMALLLFVSGVPPSEKKYDAKYGERKDYQEWKRNTPLLIPKLF